jgi:hypothetical protein
VGKVEIWLDGAREGEATLGGIRRDVLQHFARPDFLWSGWNAEISLRGARPGRHRIEMVAVSQVGKRIVCGSRDFEVVPVGEPSGRPAWKIGAEILGRTALTLLWLGLVGWAPSIGFRVAYPFSAPLCGLALFAVFADLGAFFHVRPSRSAVVLTLLSLVALAVFFGRRSRIRRPSRATLVLAAVIAGFAMIGVIPLASQGEGAVLGDIDDASRECVVADSISLYGWRIPPDVSGYFAAMRQQIELGDVRPGSIFLLSALADAYGVRAHAVHSVAMLTAGSLVVASSGLLAWLLLSRRSGFWWLAPSLVAVNTTVLANLYAQHLGSLLAASLLVSFLAFALRLAAAGGWGRIAAVAVVVAAGFVLYPEALPATALAGLLTLGAARRRGRRRASSRLILASIIAIAIDPVGFSRFVRYGTAQVNSLSNSYDRMMTGDTHYFPSPAVIWGLEAYREDARAPIGTLRARLVPLASIAILVSVAIGWRRRTGREKAIVTALLGPVVVALLANLHLDFPYGFAKFLPAAGALWSVVFVFLVLLAAEPRPGGAKPAPGGLFAAATLALVFILAAPSVRHVIRRAVRSVPAYDPAYRSLGALGAAVERSSVIVVDEPAIASREWIRYFLGANAVLDASTPIPDDGARTYRLVDRRKEPAIPSGAPAIAAGTYALVPIDPVESVAP